MVSVRCWQPQPGGHRYPGDGRAIVQMDQGASTGHRAGRFDMVRSKEMSNKQPQPTWTDVIARTRVCKHGEFWSAFGLLHNAGTMA